MNREAIISAPRRKRAPGCVFDSQFSEVEIGVSSSELQKGVEVQGQMPAESQRKCHHARRATTWIFLAAVPTHGPGISFGGPGLHASAPKASLMPGCVFQGRTSAPTWIEPCGTPTRHRLHTELQLLCHANRLAGSHLRSPAGLPITS